MKIGFVSDTHGMFDSWKNLYDKHFYDCQYIFHAGDILYHGPRNLIKPEYNPSALATELNSLSNILLFAHGNCDSEVDNMILEHPIQTPYVLADLNGKRIIMSHGHYYENAEYMQKVARRFKADLMVYGHIHIPVLEQIDGITYLNPGSPALQKTADQRGTVALWEQNVLKLIYIDNGEIYKQVNL